MIELVAARGYEASTVAELCALAGVSKRTLCERFPGGKQQCFLATYDIVVRRAETHVLAAGRWGGTASSGPARWSGCARWWRRSRARWRHTQTPRGSCCRGLGRFGAPRDGPPRDRNRFLRSRARGASVFDDGTFKLHARSPWREPTRPADLAAGPLPEWLLR